jgi:ELWxxDGT repeat protein
LETLEPRHLLTFAIDLFADLNQLGVSSNVDEYVETSTGAAFFVADDGLTGSELWTTDRTVSGTVRVKDILPGPETSAPRDLTLVGNTLFFTALDENNETDLWSSDGTESGTVRVFDADAQGVFSLSQLTASGDKLFFTAYESSSGYELWVSDGTASGTQLVRDINPNQSILDGPRDLTDVDGTLFFTTYDDGYYNRELWKSNGTAAGTMMVRDLYSDPGLDGVLGTADDDASYGSYPYYLTHVDGLLYFSAWDADGNYELYKSDGTSAGTVQVGDVNPIGASDPTELAAFGGELFFAANDASGNRHLYKTNGTNISLVADTTRGLGSTNPIDFEVVGGQLFFSAEGVEAAKMVTATVPGLTAANSRLASSGYAGIVDSLDSVLDYRVILRDHDSTRTVNTVAQCCEADNLGWVSDTARIGDPGVGLDRLAVGDVYIQSVSGGELSDYTWEWTISDAAGLNNISFAGFASGNQMFNEPNEGLTFELFLNGSSTPASTLEVSGNDLDNWYAGRDAANVNLSAPGGATITTATVRMSLGINAVQVLPDGGSEAFVVNASLTAELNPGTTKTADIGRELYKTDGTPAGTSLVRDIVAEGSSNPFQLTAVGDKLFFAADDVFTAGLELWVSDGTEAGTVRLIDSLPGTDLYGAPLDGAPQLFGGLGDRLVFSTTDPSQDRELWLSDGTTAGTEPLLNINPSSEGANVSDLIAVGTDLFFVADDGINGEAVWKADTVAGTVQMVADASPASTDQLSKLTVVSEAEQKMVFYNNTSGMAGGVYVTDGVNAPVLVSSLRPIELDAEGTMFVVADGKIFFRANDGTSGAELWVTDGVNPATLVDDLIPGTAGSDPADLTAFGGLLYFSASTDATSTISANVGRELFVTDGNAIALIADIRSGSDSSSPEQLTVAGSALFFTADDGVIGRELWRYDGSSLSLVQDIRSGASGSAPVSLTAIDGDLYFAANNGSTGVEPYRVPAGTSSLVAVGNLNPGGASSDPRDFFAALGDVFFTAAGGGSGFELWKTDGSAGSATLVADLLAGPESSLPTALFDTGQRLLFSAEGAAGTDRELWSTDGTAGSFWLVEDLYPFSFFGSDPAELTEIGDFVYFAATTPMVGRELYRLQTVAPAVGDVVVTGESGAAVADVQRSSLGLITVVFDGLIDVPAAAVELVHLDSNTALTSVLVNSRFEGGQTFVELTFDSGPSVVDRDPTGTLGLLNSLADGNYRLTLSGASIVSPVSGAAMDVDYQYGTAATDAFFRLFGDVDGDRVVDVQDAGRLALTFGETAGSPGYNSDLDFDGDGDVDSRDLGRFRGNLRGRLPFG